VVGILDESDVLLAVYGHDERFADKVAGAMTRRLETLPATAALSDLLPIFEQGLVAIVEDNGQFQGLITRVDLLNHLRRGMR